MSRRPDRMYVRVVDGDLIGARDQVLDDVFYG